MASRRKERQRPKRSFVARVWPEASSGGKNSAERQARLKGSVCLGCGSPDHWIRDCPNVTTYQAQIATADVHFDAGGMPTTCWMVSAGDHCRQDDGGQKVLDKRETADPFSVSHVPRPPPIMLTHRRHGLSASGCGRGMARTEAVRVTSSLTAFVSRGLQA